MSKDIQETEGPRYPECEVTLLGTSAHSVSIAMKVRRGLERYLREEGKTPEEVRLTAQEFMDEAMSDDADNVLTTAFRWVTVH